MTPSWTVAPREHWSYFCSASRDELARLPAAMRADISDKTLICLDLLLAELELLVPDGSTGEISKRVPIGRLIDDLWDVTSSAWYVASPGAFMRRSRFTVGCLFVALCRAHDEFGPGTLFAPLRYLVRTARNQRDPKFAEHLAAVLGCQALE